MVIAYSEDFIDEYLFSGIVLYDTRICIESVLNDSVAYW